MLNILKKDFKLIFKMFPILASYEHSTCNRRVDTGPQLPWLLNQDPLISHSTAVEGKVDLEGASLDITVMVQCGSLRVNRVSGGQSLSGLWAVVSWLTGLSLADCGPDNMTSA